MALKSAEMAKNESEIARNKTQNVINDLQKFVNYSGTALSSIRSVAEDVSIFSLIFDVRLSMKSKLLPTIDLY